MSINIHRFNARQFLFVSGESKHDKHPDDTKHLSKFTMFTSRSRQLRNGTSKWNIFKVIVYIFISNLDAINHDID